jgi:hypothetical protein
MTNCLETPWRRWEDGIRKDVKEIGWGLEWIKLAQDRDRWWDLVNYFILYASKSTKL